MDSPELVFKEKGKNRKIRTRNDTVPKKLDLHINSIE
jgi:hypothetical protein